MEYYQKFWNTSNWCVKIDCKKVLWFKFYIEIRQENKNLLSSKIKLVFWNLIYFTAIADIFLILSIIISSSWTSLNQIQNSPVLLTCAAHMHKCIAFGPTPKREPGGFLPLWIFFSRFQRPQCHRRNAVTLRQL